MDVGPPPAAHLEQGAGMARKWEDYVNLVLGIWLIVAPFALRFTGTPRNDAIWVGVIVVLVAIWALAMPSSQIAEWSDLLLGIGLFIAPWVLGFSGIPAAAWNAWIVGALIAIFSGVAIPDTARYGNRATTR